MLSCIHREYQQICGVNPRCLTIIVGYNIISWTNSKDIHGIGALGLLSPDIHYGRPMHRPYVDLTECNRLLDMLRSAASLYRGRSSACLSIQPFYIGTYNRRVRITRAGLPSLWRHSIPVTPDSLSWPFQPQPGRPVGLSRALWRKHPGARQ